MSDRRDAGPGVGVPSLHRARPRTRRDGRVRSAVAMALIVGSIIGVGIFNLPTSLAGVRPDHAGLDGADDGRRPRAGAAVRRAVAPAAGRRRAVRVRAGRVRQRARASPTPGRTGSPPGRATPRSRSAGCCTSRSSSTRATTARLDRARARRAVDPGGHQPDRRQEHGRRPGGDHDPEVRRAGVHVDGRAVLHRAAPTTRRGTSAARARSARSAAAWRSRCSATSASRSPRWPRPRSATPTATSRGPRSSARSRPRSSTCCR